MEKHGWHSDRKLKTRNSKCNIRPNNARTKSTNDTKSKNIGKTPKHINTESQTQCHDKKLVIQRGKDDFFRQPCYITADATFREIARTVLTEHAAILFLKFVHFFLNLKKQLFLSLS